MAKYKILDLETGIQEYLGRAASYVINPIIAIGLAHKGQSWSYYIPDLDVNIDDILKKELDEVDILVGHNIKFDLLYLWKYSSIQHWLLSGGRIYDTQLAEYILTGQQHKYPALRDIAVNKYECNKRHKNIEDYFKDTVKVLDNKTKSIIHNFPKGTNNVTVCKWLNDTGTSSVDVIHGPIDTINIPKHLVIEDVENDVLDTEQVMIKQINLLKQEGMYKLTIEMMESLLATTEMEYNGVYINENIFTNNQKTLEKELEMLYTSSYEIANKYWSTDE